MNLSEAVPFFLQGCRSELRHNEKTVRAYAYDLGQFVEIVGDVSVRTLNSERLGSYIRHLETALGLKASTVRRKQMMLRAFFGFLQTKGVLRESPADGLRPAPADGKRPSLARGGDLLRILNYVHEEVGRLASRGTAGRKRNGGGEQAVRDRAVIELLAATAMRVSELAALDLADVGLRERTIHVRGRGRRERTLQMESDKTWEALRAYILERRAIATDSPALFLNRFGNRLSVYAVENVFDRVRRAAGVRRRVTPQALRHAMAVVLMTNGVELNEIRDILGRSQGLTRRAYGDAVHARKRKTLNRLAEGRRLGVKAAAKN